MDSILNFFGTIINVWVFIYSCSEINKTRLCYKNKWIWFCLILVSLFIYFSLNSLNEFVRIIISYLLFVAFNIKIFRISIQQAAIISFLVYCLMIVSEMICAVFLSGIVGIDMSVLRENFFATFIMNLFISTIQLFLLSFSKVKTILCDLYLNLNYNHKRVSIYFCVLSIFSFVCFAYCMYFEVSEELMVILTLCLILVYIILTLNLFSEQSNYYRLSGKYEETLSNLVEYEKMYARERLQTHENRNDLLIIRGLIEDGKAISYIDNLLKIDSVGLKENIDMLNIIPEGGLRGLLYYKLKDMEDKKIKVSLIIGNKFKASSYVSLPTDIQAKVCKLLAIYIDNAIDSVKSHRDGEIVININQQQNKIVLKVSNNYFNYMNLDLIDNEGYTTKDNGHGYGLAIAKEIINSEKRISNKLLISGKVFSQVIEIDL